MFKFHELKQLGGEKAVKISADNTFRLGSEIFEDLTDHCPQKGSSIVNVIPLPRSLSAEMAPP